MRSSVSFHQFGKKAVGCLIFRYPEGIKCINQYFFRRQTRVGCKLVEIFLEKRCTAAWSDDGKVGMVVVINLLNSVM